MNLNFLKTTNISIHKVLTKSIIFPIRIYKIFISPLFPNSCKYYPSCSSYSIQAVQKFGIVKGTLKSIWRILRCNPFSNGGVDPVEQ